MYLQYVPLIETKVDEIKKLPPARGKNAIKSMAMLSVRHKQFISI
jgi:hypothetical protein